MVRTELNINTDILTWSIARAGYDIEEFIIRLPNVQKWIEGKKKPTMRQLEDFSKKVYLPFGYFFLAEPPRESLPIPFFRTDNTRPSRVNVNIYDTILLMQQRQDWLKDYLQDNEYEPLPFVGRFNSSINPLAIVTDIRKTLGLNENWASLFRTWQDTLEFITQKIENEGIIITFNGVVENNVYRKIPVEDCRGFVLVDQLAPFMFVNNSDSKSAQLFTIIHELAHIWTGHSAAFDFRKLQPANDPNEILCDKVAAEFLVPETAFNEVWNRIPTISYGSRYFKVSEIVIARRALDTGKISIKEFFEFYDEYTQREVTKRENQKPGGDFYATTRKRLSVVFATHVNNAVKSGKLLYRDAYKLTSLKGETFQKFFTEHF
jgi:Zn-dependent peptidase ImmA (M78 family)